MVSDSLLGLVAFEKTRMLDIQFVRQHHDQVLAAIKNKGVNVDLDRLLVVDDQRRELIGQIESLRSQRRQLASGDSQTADRQSARQLKDEITHLETQLHPVMEEFEQLLYRVPNLPSDDTPVGQTEADNKIINQHQKPPQFDFDPKPHWDMPQFFDETRATKISGSRFTFYKGGFVRLQLALVQYGFDVLADQKVLQAIIEANNLNVSNKPFEPIGPPTMMRTAAYRATGRLQPAEQTFKLADDDLWLTGSAEHSLCAYFINETIDEADLPVRFVGYNTAYRREVGSAGQDTRGAIRQHQFDKLEMESFCHPDQGLQEHKFMIAIQQYLMEQLDQPFQTVLKCTADMGGPNVRGVDIETWMAGQGQYRETHSADYLGDYQARGLKTFYRQPDGQRQLVETNDATVFAQRAALAIIENNQQADGRVRVPEVLKTYLNNREYLS